LLPDGGVLVAHMHSTALFKNYPGEAKPIWILLKEETVSGSGISWAICKSVITVII